MKTTNAAANAAMRLTSQTPSAHIVGLVPALELVRIAVARAVIARAAK